MKNPPRFTKKEFNKLSDLLKKVENLRTITMRIRKKFKLEKTKKEKCKLCGKGNDKSGDACSRCMDTFSE